MSLEVEVAESNCPLEGCDEDEAEEHSDGLKEHNHRVNLDIVDLLPEVVIQLVSIDQEVAAKQSGDAEAEQQTLDVDHELDHQKGGGQDPEPLEQIAIGNVADKRSSGALCPNRGGEGRLKDLGLGPEETGPRCRVVATFTEL